MNATSGNSSYMSRLLQVQKIRGCKAGSKVAQLLRSTVDEADKKVKLQLFWKMLEVICFQTTQARNS